MATFDAVVLDSVVETADTRTLVLDVGSAPAYRAGQYVTIPPQQFAALRSFVGYLERLKGRVEGPRADSQSAAPLEPHIAITIKEEVYDGRMKYPPLLSGFLVHQVRAGDRLAARGFAGTYVLPDDIETRTEHVLHLCAGSGSVPNLSILKDSLHRHSRLRHTFLYSNRTWADVIFREALGRLRDEHPARLKVIHTLTRETELLVQEEDVRPGRIGIELLRGVLAGEPDTFVYACGPAVTVWERRACKAQGIAPTPRFLESMLTHLQSLDVPADRIKVEAFG